MEHGGDVKGFEAKYGVKMRHDFSASVSAIGCSENARRAIAECIDAAGGVSAYPDANCSALKEAICEHYGIGGAALVAAGAGACDIIYRIASALRPTRTAIMQPAFSEYEKSIQGNNGHTIIGIMAHRNNGFAADTDVNAENCDMLFVCSPANPTGAVTPYKALCVLAEKCEKSGTAMVLDACFSDYDEEADSATRAIIRDMAAGKFPKLIVINAFTKFYGLAGLRVGYAVCGSAETASAIERAGAPWAVSSLAQAAAIASLRDTAFRKRQRAENARERKFLAGELKKIGINEVYGRANFLLIRTRANLAAELAKKGIYIRDCADFKGLGAGWFRIAVKARGENIILIDAIREVMVQRKTAVPLMVQGTMSNAGKSFLVAALCRILKQDGYRVVPFKSQNMALNSYVTADGLEVGRAQAMQAEAAGVAVDVRMNPILLKPNSDTGSQVIVNGKSRGNMTASEYFEYKAGLSREVLEAYNSLASENDVIIIEGAGSPAEINLKAHDIVNMGLARLVDAPVLLAGDIDRGGVFAQLYGTIALLDDEEKARVKGLIINKFRGDKSLLQSGIDEIERKTGKQCVGVVPMMSVALDAEDSLAVDFAGSGAGGGKVRIAIIRLPHISNATDFAPLERDVRFSVQYVSGGKELWCANPHIVILPGSKSTVADCAFMYERDLARTIHRLYDSGVLVFGVCGGFQMLGTLIKDFECVECSHASMIDGLCLLPMETSLKREKTTRQTSGVIAGVSGAWSALNGVAFAGYEIHHGFSKELSGGVYMAQGSTFGTYIHGFFDSAAALDALAEAAARRFRIDTSASNIEENAQKSDARSFREEQYNRLADGVRDALDMDAIYRIMGLQR